LLTKQAVEEVEDPMPDKIKVIINSLAIGYKLGAMPKAVCSATIATDSKRGLKLC
jgi:hypothetical protein